MHSDELRMWFGLGGCFVVVWSEGLETVWDSCHCMLEHRGEQGLVSRCCERSSTESFIYRHELARGRPRDTG